MDMMIRLHLTKQGMLMKRGMATSRLYMRPEDIGVGIENYMGVFLLDLVRILLQYEW